MKKSIKILETPMKEMVFNDSKILTDEAQRKFVISLFVGEVFNASVSIIYRASLHGF